MAAAGVFQEFEHVAYGKPGPVWPRPDLRDSLQDCLDRIIEAHSSPLHNGYTRAWLKQALRLIEEIVESFNAEVDAGRCEPDVTRIEACISSEQREHLRISGLA